MSGLLDSPEVQSEVRVNSASHGTGGAVLPMQLADLNPVNWSLLQMWPLSFQLVLVLVLPWPA